MLTRDLCFRAARALSCSAMGRAWSGCDAMGDAAVAAATGRDIVTLKMAKHTFRFLYSNSLVSLNIIRM